MTHPAWRGRPAASVSRARLGGVQRTCCGRVELLRSRSAVETAVQKALTLSDGSEARLQGLFTPGGAASACVHSVGET